MTTFLAGQILTAQMLADLEELAVPLYVRKTLDEPISSTTMQADNELALTMTANAVYTLAGLLIVTGSVDTADINVQFSFPTGSTVQIGGPGAGNAALTGAATGGSAEWIARANQTTSPTQAIPYGTSTSPTGITLTGSVEVGATAGALTLRWAPNGAGTTTVKAGSWLRLERVS